MRHLLLKKRVVDKLVDAIESLEPIPRAARCPAINASVTCASTACCTAGVATLIFYDDAAENHSPREPLIRT